jgi:DNA replication and repair protein RecF
MIQKIWIKQYRNLKELVLNIDSQTNLCIWGENNQGKTNFLEALYLICNGVSPSEKFIENTIGFDYKEAFIGADVIQKNDLYRIYIKLTSDGKRSILINNKSVKSIRALRKFFAAEYISADIIRIFQESPDFRRKDLDKFISSMVPAYCNDLKSYKKVIKQKNTYLKQTQQCDRQAVSVFNAQISDIGVRIYKIRIFYLNLIETALKSIMNQVLPAFSINTKIDYKVARLKNYESETYREILLNQLESDFEKESYSGVTLSGPHRDDYCINIDKKSLFSFYSRGINRSYAIGLKLAQLELLSKKTEVVPILLLDDTFAELDDSIKKSMSNVIESRAQLMYTSVLPTDKYLFKNVVFFQMKAGVLQRV